MVGWFANAIMAGYDTAMFRGSAAQPVAQKGVPEGCALVPIEPTDEMCEAAWESNAADYIGEHKVLTRADLTYKAMLAASPAPTKVGTTGDSALIDWLASEYLQVEPFAMPTGADDADVGWRFIQLDGNVPVVVYRHFGDDLRGAIRAAMFVTAPTPEVKP